MNVNILEFCETRLTRAVELDQDNYRTIYYGRNNHNRCVSITLDRERAKEAKGYMTISDRGHLVRLREKPIDVNITQVCASNADSAEETSDNYF